MVHGALEVNISWFIGVAGDGWTKPAEQYRKQQTAVVLLKVRSVARTGGMLCLFISSYDVAAGLGASVLNVKCFSASLPFSGLEQWKLVAGSC